MKLNIRHSTIYQYDQPGGQLIQRCYLTPQTSATQTVLDWRVTAPDIEQALRYTDAFGNVTHLINVQLEAAKVEVIAEGTVDTRDAAGVMGPDAGQVPLGAYLTPDPADAAQRRHPGACPPARGRDGP